MSACSKKTKKCRYTNFKKPCIQGDCEHWVGYPAERMNELTGGKVVETVYMCNDIWATKIAFDAARFADQAGASLDSLRNYVAEGNANIGALYFEAQQEKRLIDGNQSRDSGKIGNQAVAKALPAELDTPTDKDGGTGSH